MTAPMTDRPLILGLTGSIGMGKSETARMFLAEGVPVFDADAAVHGLMARGGAAVAAVDATFPGVVRDGAVDRTLLGARVFNDQAALHTLERIIHPLVRRLEEDFLAEAAARGAPLVVLDIPLLFETGGEGRCDRVVVVTASADVQKARVMARPGMTGERFATILAKQMPDAEKRRRAHFIIHTEHGLEDARRQVRQLIETLTGDRRECAK